MPTVRRVLIGHPEYWIRRLVQLNLERAGYVALTAATPAALRDLAVQERPDLVIVDRGWDALARELRDHPDLQAVRVVVLTPGASPAALLADQ